METYGVTAEQAAGFVSPDVRWLLDGDSAEARLYGAGDRLPIGVEAFPGQKRNDMVLWIESLNAVIAGDTLVDWGQGLQINPRWLREDMTREQVAGQLRPLLDRRWRTCSPRTAVRPIGPPSSTRSHDADLTTSRFDGSITLKP